MHSKIFFAFLAICLPALGYSLTCHRCFGNSFCNDPEHASFADGIRNATCVSTNYWSYSGPEDSFMSKVTNVLNDQFRKQFGDITARDTELQQHCLTARVFEPYDSYTLRTCITRAVDTSAAYPTLCELVEQYTASQNIYNGTFRCSQCNDTDFCNTVVLQEKSEGNGANVQIGPGTVVTLLAIIFSITVLSN